MFLNEKQRREVLRKTVPVCYFMGLFAYGFETRCFAPQTVSPLRQISPHEMSQTLTMFCFELPAVFNTTLEIYTAYQLVGGISAIWRK